MLNLHVFTSRTVLLSSFLLGPSACTAQPARTPSAQADQLFTTYAKPGSPGLAVAVVRDGSVVFSKGYGVADRDQRTPISTATVFDVGSVTKQFTGMVLALLVSEGKIQLDQEVRHYIPEMQLTLPRITVRQLAHHTSGLRDFVGGLRLSGQEPDDSVNAAAMLRFATHQTSLNFPPGTAYSYSNTNYGLLAEIVQRVSGQPIAHVVAERLLRPLGMRHSYFREAATGTESTVAPSYIRDAEGRIQLAANTLNVPGPSSLRSSVDDLVRWVVNLDSMRVGDQRARSLMQTKGRLNSGAEVDYGFGVELRHYRGIATIEHSGGWAGYTANIMYFPEQHAGVVVLSNYGVINPIDASRALADLFFADFLGTAVPINTPTKASTTVPASTLARYVGLYRLGPGWYHRITVDHGELRVQTLGEPAEKALAQSDTAFWVPAYRAAILFPPGAGLSPSLQFRSTHGVRVADEGIRAPASLEDYAGSYTSEEVEATYTVRVDNGALVIANPRGAVTKLTHAWGDDFMGARYPLTAVTFERTPDRRVSALHVFANERNRDVRFVKHHVTP